MIHEVRVNEWLEVRFSDATKKTYLVVDTRHGRYNVPTADGSIRSRIRKAMAANGEQRSYTLKLKKKVERPDPLDDLSVWVKWTYEALYGE